MRKFSLIFITLGLFALSLTVAFRQGSLNLENVSALHGSAIESGQVAAVFYTGFQAKFAALFSDVMQALLSITGQEILWAVVLLALLVELVLLYPSVRIQLKQKKVHLFHKKLVDRFNRGELSYSDTEQELYKLYAVNEKIHSRGALLVLAQVILFLSVLWGLNLLVNAPALIGGSWSVLNFNLLSKPAHFLVPLLISLLYFLHSLIKITLKEREDYLAPSQSLVAILFALVSSVVIYFFANTFALALSLYFATLITFSTVRYLLVEQQAQAWGELAQKELIEMLRHAEPHRDHFEYVSRRWNHLPVVRTLNFHLLEEALSMSLGLLLALNFFGVFEKGNELSANVMNVPRAVAFFPTDFTHRSCNSQEVNPTLCSNTAYDDPYDLFTDYDDSLSHPNFWNFFQNFSGDEHYVNFYSYSFDNSNTFDQLPPSCCLAYDTDPATSAGIVRFQAIKTDDTHDDLLDLWDGGATVACVEDSVACSVFNGSSVLCSRITGCTWNAGTSTCSGSGHVYHKSCNYQFENIPHVEITGGCPAGDILRTDSVTLNATGGSGYFQWIVKRGGLTVETLGGGIQTLEEQVFHFTQQGSYQLIAQDYFNPLNNSDMAEGTSGASTCEVMVKNPPLELRLEDQSDLIGLNGFAVELEYQGGPSLRNQVRWELLNGPGELDPATGLYTPSRNREHLNASFTVRATDLQDPDNISNELVIPYGTAYCSGDFGIYDSQNNELAGRWDTPDQNVYQRAVYRFFIKGTVIPDQFELLSPVVPTPDSIILNHSTGFSEEHDAGYLDLTFSNDSADIGDTFDLRIYDPNVGEGGTDCIAGLDFTHRGQGVRARSPKRVKISF